ncbi:hypothetical protein [Micromonospora sp. Llam0]|uniref:aromatic-ring hydroxylase C-terminal domain-containing protein n=1 Tax=Micromonospora sp. Llam0 TaxID=2485143 RepID=UPI00351A9526
MPRRKRSALSWPLQFGGQSSPRATQRSGCPRLDRAQPLLRAPAACRCTRTVTVRTDGVDVDALLIRPDGWVAWTLPAGQDLDVTGLVRAPGTWFGHPV